MTVIVFNKYYNKCGLLFGWLPHVPQCRWYSPGCSQYQPCAKHVSLGCRRPAAVTTVVWIFPWRTHDNGFQWAANPIKSAPSLGSKFIKGEKICYLLRSTNLPNFIALHQPMLEISLTKNLADTQTNSKRYTLHCLSALWGNKCNYKCSVIITM